MKIISKYIIVFALFIPGFLLAEEENSTANEQAVTQEKTDQLVDIRKAIVIAKQDLVKINKKLAAAKEETDKKTLTGKKEAIIERLQKFTHNFEEMATGGVKIVDYTAEKVQKPFNWQDELLEIFKPMMAELKALTERPRAIEALRTEKEYLESEIPVADNALTNINKIKNKLDDEVTLAELLAVETEWQHRKDNLKRQLKLVSFQLEEKLNPPDIEGKSIGDKIYEFAVGRGLTIVLALIAFIGTFVFLAILSKQAERRLTRSPNRQKIFFQRAMNLVLRFFTVLIALLVTMAVLYIRGDWLILGLILIVILAFGWALRTQLPNYITEVKVMLNRGSVREGEKVIYDGIPWRVTSLNFFTELTNPSLSGGVLKLPISIIIGLVSRQPGENEGWFPNEKGDYVILDNDLYGKVIEQTPDYVQMSVLGGSVKTMATTDYLALNPRNLMTGFGMFVSFGLDYDLQGKITTDIPETLEAELKHKVENEEFNSHLTTLRVEFNQASGSSLDLVIIAIFNGEAADHYFGIRRFFQKATVEICTEHQWNIPFDNVTVHLDKQV